MTGWVYLALVLIWLAICLLTILVFQMGARLDKQTRDDFTDRYGSPPGEDYRNQ
jgi:hypothetical protein